MVDTKYVIIMDIKEGLVGLILIWGLSDFNQFLRHKEGKNKGENEVNDRWANLANFRPIWFKLGTEVIYNPLNGK